MAFLYGGIVPRSFYPDTQIPKNPTVANTNMSNWETGELVSDLRTGRLWISGATGDALPILPYVRNDGTPSVVATTMTNDTGKMKVSNATGSTAGELNAFDQLRIDANGITTPNIVSSTLVANSTGKFVAGTVSNRNIGSNVTISSTTALTTLNDLNTTVEEDGIYRFDLYATFTHNNACDISLGIQYRESASSYFVPRATSVSIGNSNAYATATCSAIFPLSASTVPNHSVRAVCVASATGVTVRKEPLFSFPYLPTSIPNTTFATYMTCTRIG